MYWLIGIAAVVAGFLSTKFSGKVLGGAWQVMRGQRKPSGCLTSRKQAGLITVAALGGYIVGLGVILGGIGYPLIKFAAEPDAPRIAAPACDSNRDALKAWDYAQDAVKEKLKAPATAQFESFNPARVVRDGCNYLVVSEVDAENSYGAKLRNHFSVSLSKNPETYRWTVESVVMGAP